MPSGTLEVVLVSAHGLKSGDLFSKTDAYAVITCGNHTQKSNTARNQGSNPTWNQKFVFHLDETISELSIKVMDEDVLTADDELGITKVPLAAVFQMGKVAPTAYNVVRKNGKFKGEMKLSLAFIPRRQESQHGGIYNPNQSLHGQVHGSMEDPHGSLFDGPYGSGSGGGWAPNQTSMGGPYGRSNDGPYGSGSGGGWNQGTY